MDLKGSKKEENVKKRKKDLSIVLLTLLKFVHIIVISNIHNVTCTTNKLRNKQ